MPDFCSFMSIHEACMLQRYGYLGSSDLSGFHSAFDSLIAIAYYAVAIMLVYILRQRSDIPFKGMVWLFSGWILSSGTTYLIAGWTPWHLADGVLGLLKTITVLTSYSTAVALFMVIPKVLSMPNRHALEEANQALQEEVNKRQQVELALQHRLEFGWLLERHSTRFINLDAAELSNGINLALEELAAFIGVEHSYVFKVSPERETFSLTNEWTANSYIPAEQLIDMPYARFPWALAQLSSGQLINVPSVANLDQPIDQTSWENFQVKSLLSIPLSLQETFFGWIGVASHTHEQNWSETHIQFLKLFGEMLTNTLHRKRIESEREAAQQQLQNVFTLAPSLNCIAGLDGYFKLLSPSFGKLLGYSTDKLLGQPFLNFVHPEDQPSTLAEVQKLSTGDHTIGFENRYRHQNGSYHWLSWYATAIPDEETVYATAVDITERKYEQLELAQKNRSLKLLADLSLQLRQSKQIDEVFEQTAKSLQLFLNTSRVLVLQLIPEGCTVRAESVLPGESKIIGQSFTDPCATSDYINKYQGGTPSIMIDVSKAEIQACHRELLQTLHVKSNIIAPIFLHSQIWGLLIAHQCDQPRSWSNLEVDLLKQVADQISVGLAQWQLLHQLEELVDERTTAFLRSENQFRSLFEAAPDLIYILNPEGQIQTVNPAVSESLGFSEAELVHHPLDELLTPDCQETCKQILEQLISHGVHRQEMTLHRKDNSTLTVDCSCKFVNTGDDPFILVLQRDISEQKEVEAIKDEFVSVVSHELRTPLTSIHGSLKLLGTGNLGTLSRQGTKVLDIALRNTDRLSRLINDVLDLERVENGKVVMSQQHCPVSDLMLHAVQEMQSMATGNQIKLEISRLDCGVYADPDHIIQTLTNLLSNAIKFSPTGGVVWLSAQDQDQEVMFEVKDKGRGIPREKLKKIFERFQQVDVSDSRRKGGTGLGLAICQQIVERHDGKIWAESEEGRGSSFYFTLPKSMV